MSNKIYLEAQEAYIEPELLAKKIATFIFIETANNTNSGNWCVDEEEIISAYHIALETLHKITGLIVKELETTWSEQVAEVYYHDNDETSEFDVTLYEAYIPGFLQDDTCLEETDED